MNYVCLGQFYMKILANYLMNMIRLNEWWRGLWCLTPQQYFSYIVAVSFIGGVKQSTTDMSQVTDKLYHIMLY